MEEKTRYSDDELKEFEAIIDQKLAKAEEELNYYLNQIKELAENDGTKVKGLDDGQGTIESTRLQQMASRQTKLIQHLNNAKMRISNKVYGICRETGK
ncbi:MAG: TraR/DksA family transcriptional regulator, partial [Saprospiraceae bacterium]